MKIHFNGAAQTVTGSQHLLEINGKKLMLDCGLFQGKRDETYKRNLNFAYDTREIDAVILSHAHIDHSGNLPNLVKSGFEGSIFTTEATAKLADVMLRDAGHIQEADVEFLNKKRALRGELPLDPLYTVEDAAHVQKHFKPVSYGQAFHPIPGVTAHLVDAGHILGSAAIVLDITENGRTFRLWFSGDIGRLQLPLLKDPVMPEDVDYLMMECTYGDKSHGDPQEAYEEFRDVVNRTANRGGKVIVPAFAVGRTQELVYDLNQMITRGEIKPLPVYVDSPLAVASSQIFQEFPQYFDEETRRFVLEGRHPALNFKGLTYIQSVEESKKLNDMHGPMVIISASGMAETGRILHHLRNSIEDSHNSVVIVSWQAPYTLGRRLADHEREIRIFGQEYECQAEVTTIGGLSAHAGQDMLLKYAQSAGPKLKKLILVHGEPDAETAFRAKLDEAGIGPIEYPELGEIMDI